jgi:hypothetical protein
VTCSVLGNDVCRICFRFFALNCCPWSTLVRWRPLLSAAIVTQLVTRLWTRGQIDPLLRRSFQARDQPARMQIEGRSRCPWVTASDRSFPPVLARMWHGCGSSRRLPAQSSGGSQRSPRVGGKLIIRS